MRQGPHHGAHKSTRTGIRGVPAAAAGTRFAWPQCSHLTNPPAMISIIPRPEGLPEPYLDQLLDQRHRQRLADTESQRAQ